MDQATEKVGSLEEVLDVLICYTYDASGVENEREGWIADELGEVYVYT